MHHTITKIMLNQKTKMINKILSLQVSELPESDQIILNQISGLTKPLKIKVDKLNTYQINEKYLFIPHIQEYLLFLQILI